MEFILLDCFNIDLKYNYCYLTIAGFVFIKEIFKPVILNSICIQDRLFMLFVYALIIKSEEGWQ